MKKRVLISVSNKEGIVDFSKKLIDLGYEIISTGGTMKLLKENGVACIGISEVTGFPECFDGRVKTLHPLIHGGILNIRDNEKHIKQKNELGVEDIDMIVVNLYPFKEAVKKGLSFEDCIENIDIGGPTMIRSGAKNFKYVLTVVNPCDYDEVIEKLSANKVDEKMRLQYAKKVFKHTSIYDSMVNMYLERYVGKEEYENEIVIACEKVQDLRYGENPHQKAAFYKPINMDMSFEQLHGKELSFNNYNDINSAIEMIKDFNEPTAIAIKHTNPCGASTAKTIHEAYVKTYECDPVSIYGGIIVVNRELDEDTALEINKIFIEIVIAPSYSSKALEVLKSKKNIRILKVSEVESSNEIEIRSSVGGLLIQDKDNGHYEKLETVTSRLATNKEMEDLEFAWKLVKHVKSNAIVIVKDKKAIGIGPGQVNRIWALKNAIRYSREDVKGAVMASDAFFPFGDCVSEAANAGITAIIQPGGSIRDQESIDEANKNGLSMLFTGMRHFKH